MKAERALIGIFQKMRIKNLRGVSEVRYKKKLDSFTLVTSKNHLIRNFLRNGRVRVNIFNLYIDIFNIINQYNQIKILFWKNVIIVSHMQIFVFQTQDSLGNVRSKAPDVSNWTEILISLGFEFSQNHSSHVQN